MNDAEKTSALAEKLMADMAGHRTFEPLRLDGEPIPADVAYEIQHQVVERGRQTGYGDIVGYKVGLTSGAMQRFCGVNEPILGRILEKRQVRNGAQLRRADYGRVGLESELALRISRHLPELDSEDDDVNILLDYVDLAAAAFEIIDDRNADYGKLDAYSIAAENSWNAGMILGMPVPARALGTFRDLTGKLFVNGRQEGQGSSNDVLGDPLNVLAWLGSFASRSLFRVEPGQWVLTGSMIATRFPAAGDKFRFELGAMPPVEVAIV